MLLLEGGANPNIGSGGASPLAQLLCGGVTRQPAALALALNRGCEPPVLEALVANGAQLSVLYQREPVVAADRRAAAADKAATEATAAFPVRCAEDAARHAARRRRAATTQAAVAVAGAAMLAAVAAAAAAAPSAVAEAAARREAWQEGSWLAFTVF